MMTKSSPSSVYLTRELGEMQILSPPQTPGDRASIVTRLPGDLKFEKPCPLRNGTL